MKQWNWLIDWLDWALGRTRWCSRSTNSFCWETWETETKPEKPMVQPCQVGESENCALYLIDYLLTTCDSITAAKTKRREDVYTYRISSSASPRNACSSKHVISLLSTCKLRNDVAPLNVFRPIICNELCDRSLTSCKMENQWINESNCIRIKQISSYCS